MSEDVQLLKAKRLIGEKQYAEARSILVTLKHPTAKKWLAQLNQRGGTALPTIDQDAPKQRFAVPGIVLAAFNIVIAAAIAGALSGGFFSVYKDMESVGDRDFAQGTANIIFVVMFILIFFLSHRFTRRFLAVKKG